METKVMNTRLAVALLLGLLLARQEAAAVSYDDPATEAAPTTVAATATPVATATATPAATATDAAAETTPTTPSYGKATKADCEIPGACDVKTAKAEQANAYTRGCSKATKCRD